MARVNPGAKNGAAADVGNPTLDKALIYQVSALSFIPVRPDGSKAPQLVSWDEFKGRRPTRDEAIAWFSGQPPPGIAIVGGKVSGNLLVLDFEFLDFYEEWLALVEAQAPGLAARLPMVRTPGKDEAGGRHVYARSTGPAVPTSKLARITRAEAERRTGDPGKTTAVEVKAEKGYVLTVGCPPNCHETGRVYEHLSGPPIEETPTLTESEVNLLLSCARALERGDKASADRRPGPAGDANRPGDDFNRRASWGDVLPDGWRKVRENGEVVYLCRPGKDAGVSATIGYCRSERAGPKLYVFSTNAEPFEAERSYSKFEAYALLNHGGDFKAAARELARRGYGECRQGSADAAPRPAEGPPTAWSTGRGTSRSPSPSSARSGRSSSHAGRTCSASVSPTWPPPRTGGSC
jgi:putative DNA primase/helicase